MSNGNRGEKVDRRVIPLGWGYIRGYAAPRYEKAVNGTGGNTGTGKKSVEAVATEVLAGKWGNGKDRLIFLFEVSNFYVTNITVCAIIKTI